MYITIMKLKNYCIVLIGQDLKGGLEEIERVSDGSGKPRNLDGKGMIISTFSSFLSTTELNTYFTDLNRNFLMFELDKKTSAFNINHNGYNEMLFGFLNQINNETITEEFLKAVDEVKPIDPSYIGSIKLEKPEKVKIITEEDISKMSRTEKDRMVNVLLENGVENLNELDKKILGLLSK